MFHEVSSQLFEHVDQMALPGVADQLLKEAGHHKVWLFSGEMGAGKTTLIKELCRHLGVKEVMSSPTFSIINEYETPNGSVFHFDFFRIRSEAEAFDTGATEYFYSGSFCFVEWPEKIPGLIPPGHVHVHLNLETQALRTISISVHDGKEKNRI